jgi:hypothetical protein
VVADPTRQRAPRRSSWGSAQRAKKQIRCGYNGSSRRGSHRNCCPSLAQVLADLGPTDAWWWMIPMSMRKKIPMSMRKNSGGPGVVEVGRSTVNPEGF